MLVGQTIGPFDILKELGSGAMGTVYLARWAEKDTNVAIKMIAMGLLGNESAVARFEREVSILKQLKHPNIVKFYNSGRYKKTPFFIMEYIQGESLDRVLARKGRFTWQEVVSLGKQLCSALQHSHEKGIIHRDLKPSNLMILKDGTLKLTDFGIAKDSDVTALTGANSTIGTAAYMSPEQCRGEKNLSAKSDLYSLGIVFYELLTGRKPFVAESPVDMFLMHVNGTFERPSRHVMEIPVWLDTLVCQMMEKKPEHRPLDAAMVVKALEEIEERMSEQKSAAAQLANARVVDAPKVTADLDAQDIEAARSLKMGTKKKAKTAKVKAKNRAKVFQAIGLVGAIVGLIALAWIFTRPESAESMLSRIHELEKIKQPDESQTASLREAVENYLSSYGSQSDPETERLRSYSRSFEVMKRERQLQNRYRAGLKPEEGDNEDAYKITMNALRLEDTGDLRSAREQWQKLTEKYATSSKDPEVWIWGMLGFRKIAVYDELDRREAFYRKRLETEWLEERDHASESDQERVAVEALRLEVLGDLSKSRERWIQLQESTKSDFADRLWLLWANLKIRSLDSQIPTRTSAEEAEVRKKFLTDKLAIIRTLKESGEFIERKQGRNLCREIRDLYKNDPSPDVVQLAKQAEQLLPTIPR
ncbi:serine/threonine protein kinase [Tuwongella immobilis]|uniref:non-specific serine/threonine protein kinase n=1 Tax=Tuwongella immobilis TaxID=692036 RepID=A0A6C2YTA8_9BACT|nr:serine/threonine-protein kinase [Tuwongella immobilis]VIP04706.1 serine threonine protein kinase : Putative uncharacterized protein OS=Gemmata sp. Wa1-1 PE=3 SV=1: Pkinase [Tuwongella immobilis]VTS06771.1 serine threonine protein kinase : Putative uncharacterized protein OS=Gemmata sp. Wa1-1 PE=3 SV=1: Pkinase [Tuwongella immobilis]